MIVRERNPDRNRILGDMEVLHLREDRIVKLRRRLDNAIRRERQLIAGAAVDLSERERRLVIVVTDRDIAGVLKTRPGETYIGVSTDYFREFPELFKRAIKKPIVINPDDSGDVELSFGIEKNAYNSLTEEYGTDIFEGKETTELKDKDDTYINKRAK
mgnify:CR=1 FL=1